MTEVDLHQWFTLAQFGLALATAASLVVVVAPYGRHNRSGWGLQIPSRLGWIAMESPAVLLFAWIFWRGDARADTAPLALFALWQFHYLHRAFLFPFRMRSRGKPMPAVIVGLGICFNGLNAYINARWISHFGKYSPDWLDDPRFVVGAGLMLIGWWINVISDEILFRLRKPNETGYKIPRGGLYRWVSCPNYLGEIVEWSGWALATWSLPGLAFAVYTAANLGPRAWAHHRWYRQQFPDYPKDRTALLPFVGD